MEGAGFLEARMEGAMNGGWGLTEIVRGEGRGERLPRDIDAVGEGACRGGGVVKPWWTPTLHTYRVVEI